MGFKFESHYEKAKSKISMKMDVYLANEAWKAHLIKMQDEKEMLFEKLKSNSNLTEVQERKIFKYAWDEGHSSGEYEVESIFGRLVELVEDCLK